MCVSSSGKPINIGGDLVKVWFGVQVFNMSVRLWQSSPLLTGVWFGPRSFRGQLWLFCLFLVGFGFSLGSFFVGITLGSLARSLRYILSHLLNLFKSVITVNQFGSQSVCDKQNRQVQEMLEYFLIL